MMDNLIVAGILSLLLIALALYRIGDKLEKIFSALRLMK